MSRLSLVKPLYFTRHSILKTIQSSIMTATTPSIPTFIDIGVNLTDEMYSGMYHGKKAHPADLDQVMKRSQEAGVIKQMVTVGQLSEVKPALELANRYQGLYITAGIHPTRTSQVGKGNQYIEELKAILDKDGIGANNPSGKIIALGECGLDYDRLHFSSKTDQLTHFELQLQLAKQYQLPLFLHCRAAQSDFVSILKPHLTAEEEPSKGRRRAGVVHCFTGTVAEMRELVDMGLFIGLTGCSFKTQEGIEIAKEVPLDRLLLETDAPWCDLRATHASAPLLATFTKSRSDLAQLYQPASVKKKEQWDQAKTVKGRNEPCAIGLIAAVIAQAKEITIEEVASVTLENSRFLLGI